jgi:hypothetical protein
MGTCMGRTIPHTTCPGASRGFLVGWQTVARAEIENSNLAILAALSD